SSGERTYQGAVPCERGCRLQSLGWSRPVSTFGTVAGTVTVTALAAASPGATARPVNLRLDNPSVWRPRSPDDTDAQT
ncbi:hypothetical protein ABTE71_20990, partial [Acinetobacter baumannii]